MASITDMQVLYDRPNADGTRDVKYRYTALSNNSQERIVDQGPFPNVPADFDEQSHMAARAPLVLQMLKDQDLAWHSENAAQDTLWIDMGGYFEKAVPEWSTWDEASEAVSKFWLNSDNKLDLINLQLFLSHTSNSDITTLLSCTQTQVTGIRGDVQEAVDTNAALSTYEPWVDDSGTVREP